MKKTILGGLVLGIITILTSISLNGTIFARFYDPIPIVRPIESWQVIPGMAIATLSWGILTSIGFKILYKGIPGVGFKKGLNYGLILWMIFIPFVELWNYLQYDIPFMVVIAGVIVWFIAMPLGGMAFAAIHGTTLND